MEKGRCSTLVSEKSDGNLRSLLRRDLQNHVKPTTKTTSIETPPRIGPITTVDLPLALLEPVEPDIADVANVSEPPELDAGELELDARELELDVIDVAGDEVPAVVATPVGKLLSVTPYEKTSKESRWYSWKGGTYVRDAVLPNPS